MSWDLIFQHLFIVLAASLLSIAVGLPLGIWAYVSKTARPVILRVVDLLQTIPSLALLGIIMVVLNADDTIAGIVTKTSVARSVAENLWGEAK